MALALSIVGILAALLGLAVAVVGVKAWLQVLRQGTRAAEKAYQRGDTLGSYFDPSKTRPVEGPQHDARAAIGGRNHRRFGVVAVSEHAPDHA